MLRLVESFEAACLLEHTERKKSYSVEDELTLSRKTDGSGVWECGPFASKSVPWHILSGGYDPR